MNVLNCTAVFISRATQQRMAGHIITGGVDQQIYACEDMPPWCRSEQIL
jgi:hypothetical protein